MPGEKQLIVDKVIERLQTRPGYDEGSVFYFKNPFREIEEAELPCIKVAIMGGKADRINNAIEYKHGDTLVIAYITQGNADTLTDALYQAADDLLDCVILDENNSEDLESLYHLVDDLVFEGWDMELKNAAVGTGGIVLRFNLTYHTKHVLEFGNLTGFEVTVKHAEAGADTDPIAVDSVDVPTE